MAGVKGRSGRKSWKEELEMRELVQCSIRLLKWALKEENNQVPLAKKIDIALHIAAKAMPTKLQHSGEIVEKVEVEFVN